ncbi:MAG: outer membrane protein transport protein [Thiogranum sp.]|nr:outer membrane protein transport protein [Thiogranum sp.]
MKFVPGSLPRTLLTTSIAIACGTAQATNGMNMEGYGPIATAMGGASMAYDNGTAAMMNNPATLGLMDEGDRLDLFAGLLGPDVDARVGNMTAESDGTAYAGPAGGWVRKNNGITLGVGIYGQGGMGTEYAGDTFLGDPAMTGARLENLSELSVGRVILPLAWQANDRLSIGGSFDFVWAGLDLKMAMNAAQFNALATGQSGSLSGSMLAALPPAVFSNLEYAYYDFSNGSDFTGEAQAYGYAGKLGFTYQVNQRLSVGATYHSKTLLNDMQTDNATVNMSVAGMGVIPVSGEITIEDFQWPATWAVGMQFQATPSFTLVADVKQLLWEDVMDAFTMTFKADQTQASPGAAGIAGTSLTSSLYQRWEDQTVYQIGGAWRATPALTLRAGYNYAKNPVPDEFLNALFPAIVEQHLTAGFGYHFDDARSIDFSLVKGLEKSATNPGNGTTIPAVESNHGQLNFQFIYTHRF